MFILDACRHDIFEEIIDQDPEPVIVDASNSLEYVEKYMRDHKFEDTIYVTANPFGSHLDDTFYKKSVTFQTDESGEKADVDDLEKNWSPEYVHNEAIKSFESDKRIVVHFMQPHAPYFGSQADKIREKCGYELSAWGGNSELSHLLDLAQKGKIDRETLMELYIGNLNVVLDYALSLAKEFGGKTVITSDHGEMLGESKSFLRHNMGGMRRYMGHGYGIFTEELRKVPWFIKKYGNRRRIIPGEIDSGSQIKNTDRQLKALGYK